MPRKLPRHLTWLEAFVAAVETGSLEAAAQHLGVARSVVSEHLRALEETLTEGEALVERGPGRRLRPAASACSPEPRPPSTSWISNACGTWLHRNRASAWA